MQAKLNQRLQHPALTGVIAGIFMCAASVSAPARGRAQAHDPQSGKHFARILIIVLENQNYESASKDRYLAQLAKKGARFTNFRALGHPSYPNYLAMIAGSSFGVQSDLQINFPDDKGHKTIANLLDWKCYAEDYPAAPKPFLGDRGKYVRKHVPFLSFAELQHHGADHIVSVDPHSSHNRFVGDVENFRNDPAKYPLPRYIFYVPNLDDDGHDPSSWPPLGLKKASRWLSTFLEEWIPLDDKMKGTLVVVTFDESQDNEATNRIYTVFLGDMVKPGNMDKPYNHYSVLKTVEDNFSLPSLHEGDGRAEPITGIWK